MSFPIDQNQVNNKTVPSHNLFGFDALIKHGHEVEWVCPDTHLNKWEKKLSKVLGVNFSKLLIQFKCISLSKNFDIIYSGHDMHLIILGFLRLLKICRKPVFVLCHFSYNLTYVKSVKSKWFKFIERYIVFAGIDRIVFANERLYNMAKENFKIPYKHSKWVDWGADIEFFNNNSTTERLENKFDYSSMPYFAAVGTANRDYSTLVSAFKRKQSINLKVFGRLGESISATNCKNITFYNLNQDEDISMILLSKYYLNSTAVLIPVLQENDVPNGATVLIEALAAGKPVIITDFDTNYIDVEKEGIGLKVKVRDVNGWTDAITYLTNNPDIVTEMSLKAKLLANTKFNYSIFTNKLINEIDLFYQTQKSQS
ncbi:MAG: glycosyltransferase [Lacibacter sp.]